MLLALPFIAGSIHAQFVNLATTPGGQDVVRSIPNNATLNRIGHLQAGFWTSGWGTWSTLGRPITSALGNTPNDQALYGLTVNDTADRVFFGTRRLASNRANGVIAWGDDNYTNQANDPDRIVFEFHDSNAGNNIFIRQAMTMMPNPANNGVWIGVNQYSPNNTFEINSTQYTTACLSNGQPQAPLFAAPTGWAGLRFTDLTRNCIPQANPGPGVLSVDNNGDVIYVPGLSHANNGLSVSGNSVQLGAVCGSGTVGLASLTSNRAVPLAGFNFVFSGAAGRVGIGTNCTPANKLEVNNNTGPNWLSGLRLTDLAGGTPAAANNRVLSVNNAGDVILTQFPTSAFGGICGTTPPALSSSWEIPMSTFNYVFSGQGINTTNVGIGTNCTPSAKLHVNQSSGSTGGSTGLLVENNDVGPCLGTTTVIGLKSIVNTPNNITGDQYRIGGWFEVPNPNNCGLVNNFALYVPQNGGFVSIGYPNPGIPGGGLVDINGVTNSVGGYSSFSDERLKNSITSIPNALEKIKNLRSVTFKWNKTTCPSMEGVHSGFVAQELEKIIPHAVTTGKDGFKGVFYDEIIPYLVSGIQEQQTQIDQQTEAIALQQKQIDELKAIVQSLANNSSSGELKKGNVSAINLSDKNAVVLNQNVPNPFAESTVITYNIPSDFGKAQIIFTANDGKIIKVMDVTTKGEGRLNVFANDLSSGMYSYSLVIDGKTIDTKKMIKE